MWGGTLIEQWITHSRQRKSIPNGAATTLVGLGFVAKLALWAVVLLLMLDNLGINITALAASLGIGGVAVALAVQNILGDLLASLSIVIDKPFVLGDSIAVDGLSGTVEHIGLKTTRIRADSGEQIVFANGDLLKSRLRNFKLMRERTIVFGFGVLQTTTAEQLEAIPSLVREIITPLPATRFQRAHFKNFGDSSYNFEAVYTMLTPDYGRYMDTQQAINLALVRVLTERGISLAAPSRRLYIDDSFKLVPVDGSPEVAAGRSRD